MLTREQIEQWRKKILAKIISDFENDEYQSHCLRLQASYNALCNMALSALDVRERCSWNYMRSVLSQGADIHQDYLAGRHAGYEEYSARLDAAAHERALDLGAQDQREDRQVEQSPGEVAPITGTAGSSPASSHQSPPEQVGRDDRTEAGSNHCAEPAPARGLSAVEEQHISERLARCLQVDDAIGAEICEAAYVGLKWRDNSSLEEWFPFTAKELDRLRSENSHYVKIVEDLDVELQSLRAEREGMVPPFVTVHSGRDGVWVNISDGNGGGYSVNLDAVSDAVFGAHAKRCADHYRAMLAAAEGKKP